MSLLPARGTRPPAKASSLLAELDWPRVRHRFGLSPRELQVLQCVVQGRRNSQIAQELQLAIGTVKTYAARIRAKVGLRKRQHLTIAALDAVLERTLEV